MQFSQDRFRSIRRNAVTALAVMLAMTGCATADQDQTIVVSAATSLAGAFGEIESAFEAATPGVDVELNLAGSSRLKEQIVEGAEVDVFASANVEAMEAALVSIGRESEAVVFALNTLAIGVPLGNPGGVSSLADFATESLFIGLCLEAVPCGLYAAEAFDAAGITPSVDTRESDVRSLMLKIELGEVDAGVVYLSDIIGSAGSVGLVEIPDAHNVIASYPIAVVANEDRERLASAFVAFVLSDDGRAILASYGFELP